MGIHCLQWRSGKSQKMEKGSLPRGFQSLPRGPSRERIEGLLPDCRLQLLRL